MNGRYVECPNFEGMTVPKLLEWMEQENVPLRAQLVYAGCGSHIIAFEWYEETEDSLANH